MASEFRIAVEQNLVLADPTGGNEALCLQSFIGTN